MNRDKLVPRYIPIQDSAVDNALVSAAARNALTDVAELIGGGYEYLVLCSTLNVIGNPMDFMPRTAIPIMLEDGEGITWMYVSHKLKLKNMEDEHHKVTFYSPIPQHNHGFLSKTYADREENK